MIFPNLTQEELAFRMMERLKLLSPEIESALDTSIIGSLVKVCAAEIVSLRDEAADRVKDYNILTAGGTDLDFLGLQVGVVRKAAQKSTSTGLNRAVRITNPTGGSVNVPTGTRLYSSLDPTISFYTLETVAIGAGSSENVHVEAADFGEFFNLGIGQLDSVAFVGAQLRAFNFLPLSNGSFQESDDSYRARIVQEFQRRYTVNAENISSLVRSLPGVKDAIIVERYRGPGTFEVIVIPYNQSELNQVLLDVNSVLSEAVVIGTEYSVRGPSYKQVDVDVNVIYSPSAGARRTEIREAIRSIIYSFIDNLPIENGSGNGTFYTNQLLALAVQSDRDVLDASIDIRVDEGAILLNSEFKLLFGEKLTVRSIVVE